MLKSQIIKKCSAIDAQKYDRSRNFVTGAVTRLSPYITHGVITTHDAVYEVLKNYDPDTAEKLLKELIRKEWFRHVHRHKKDGIFEDMEVSKTGYTGTDILPSEIQIAQTGEGRLDTICTDIMSGYAHNHQRMWFASYMTHYHRLYRKQLADRSYYHFLDGDLSCNHLSRQRVASTFSSKPYIRNADNMSRYRPGHTAKTLDADYPEIEKMLFGPRATRTWTPSQLISPSLPPSDPLTDPTCIHILTPWHLGAGEGDRVVVIDPDFLARHPRSANRIARVTDQAHELGCKVAYMRYADVISHYAGSEIHIYETENPIYREIYDSSSHVTRHATLRYAPDATKTYCSRFFKYWSKVEPVLREIRKNM